MPPVRERRFVAPGSLLALPGILWGVTLFLAYGFVVQPRPSRPSQFLALLLLAALTACWHAGLLGGLAAGARRAGAWIDLALASAGGVAYTLLGMSLIKFSATGAHLRYEDLWFLASSATQAMGEGTPRERVWLSATALAPLLIGGLLFALLRWARARPTEGRAGWLAALSSVAGIALVATVWPTARFATLTLLPESAIAARHARRLLEPPLDWQPDPTRNARLEVSPSPPPSRRWNVLVVMLESVPWKRLLGPEARPDSTPHLLALAAESIAFDRAYAVSTHSDYAQTAILASLFPRKSDRHDYFRWLDYPRALPWDVLGPHGWRSAVFSTQNEHWGNMIGFLTTPRLEFLRHSPDFPDAPRRGEGSETKIFEQTVVAAFLDWVRAAPAEPFVAYLNFQATHYPYVWPPDAATPYGEAPIDFPSTYLGYPTDRVPRMLDRFHNALAYVDRNVGALVEGLRAAELWDRTVVLLVADHGEAFYEHGLPTHGTSLLEEQVRVPMLLRIPSEASRTVYEPVSTLDALPTIYRSLGLRAHSALQGSNEILASNYDGTRRAIPFTIQGMTREDGVLLNGWKRIVNHDRREGALFDLLDDPGETRNVVLVESARASALQSALDDFLNRQIGYYGRAGWRSGWGPPSLPSANPPDAADETPESASDTIR